jgi:ubiquinone/menaquinone biosynthesis C-methylase UbiE
MERRPEPELMTEDEQAEAYASADFEDAHSRLIRLFRETFHSHAVQGTVLDLGCGPGDIACRFAVAYPDVVVYGVDGSEAMLRQGASVMARYPGVADRVNLEFGFLPDCTLPESNYDVVISNSLLHHLTNPQVLWNSVLRFAAPGAPVFVMDLQRPRSVDDLELLVEQYAADEPDILRRDFANSLHAAYAIPEVQDQLAIAGLTELTVREVTDRHMIISGYAP